MALVFHAEDNPFWSMNTALNFYFVFLYFFSLVPDVSVFVILVFGMLFNMYVLEERDTHFLF